VRTVQRWLRKAVGEDGRAGPKTRPGNKLTEAERRGILAIVNLPQFRDLSPKKIVPMLADMGRYLASESTFYRILRAASLLKHRAASKPAKRHRPRELVAKRPNQVWSWDITYLYSPIRGAYFYLYLIMDVFSRKIVGWAVHEAECQELASDLIEAACAVEGVDRDQLDLHSDNGGPMKGAIMVATLTKLGVMPSFSRPSVSNDNPFSESLFRTLKYCPEYPSQPFATSEAASAWVTRFVDWYNNHHLHSGIRMVTPAQRHAGEDHEILKQRQKVYKEAHAKHPERWSKQTRDWSRIDVVRLNPAKGQPASGAA
jgi:putative transposase